MAISVNCPTCLRDLTVPDVMQGQTVKCSTCGEQFRAEAALMVGSDSPSAPQMNADSMASAQEQRAVDPRPTEPYAAVEPQSHEAPVAEAAAPESVAQVLPPRIVACRFCAESMPADAAYCPLCGEHQAGQGGSQPSPRWLRRDCEPHRGTLIRNLGVTGIVAPIVSMLLCGFAPILQVAGLACSLIAWVMANKDLTQMREGRMDPAGDSLTRAGKTYAMIGTFLSLGLLMTCGSFMSFFWLKKWRF